MVRNDKLLKKTLQKVEEGRKLTTKEKKIYKEYQKAQKYLAEEKDNNTPLPEHDLTDFSLVTRTTI